MPDSDTQDPTIKEALQTFEKEKREIVHERTTKIKELISEIDHQKEQTIKNEIAKLP
ncbi:hypothetical protein KBC54_03555 [Patescibacteria group bacterium]|nr:hypothetical protein [Patescibacteria group bacterium]